ncbi:MAG: hypothetical protein HC795_00915 [Coleofasciculaceae cyanobacterium RL_1_1]|nr:hypothetical protein [Coleofasciculaceae cyanobacterium RL_1_1]
MLLHSWFRAIHFLGIALVISPLNAAPIAPWLLRTHPSQVSTSTIRLIPPSIPDTEIDRQSSDSPEDRAYQVCMAAFATLTPTPIHTSTTQGSLGSDPRFDRSIEHPDAATTRLDPSFDPVLTAPGIALYRQTSADRRNNHDDDETFEMSSEADAGRDQGNPDDRPIANEATTLIYRVDLSQGAQLDLAGAIALDPSDTEVHPSAAYDTQRDPHVPPRSLTDHWHAINAAHPDRAFAAINGQFLGRHRYGWPFPLRQGAKLSAVAMRVPVNMMAKK